VPDAAPGLAELPQRDAREAMVAGLEQHLLEQDPRGRLTLGQLLARQLGLPEPRGELVPDELELAEIEQARPAGLHARAWTRLLGRTAHLEHADDRA
jgi:hypothetical protein